MSLVKGFVDVSHTCVTECPHGMTYTYMKDYRKIRRVGSWFCGDCKYHISQTRESKEEYFSILVECSYLSDVKESVQDILNS